MTTSNLIAVGAASRQQLFARFRKRPKQLTHAEIEQRFDDLLKYGYAHACRGLDGQWRFVLIAK
jgi:hypothetical protein